MRKFFIVLTALIVSMISFSIFAQQVKIAVVNPQQIIEKSKEGQRIKVFLQTFFDSKQTDINAKETELKALDEKIKDPKIAEDKKEDLRSQFQQKLYEAQAFAKSSQDDMDQKSTKMKEEFGLKLDEVVKKYATSKGISLVLEKNITLYSADTMDVTTDIIAEMDKAYPGK
jgi:outer membrane protein